MVVTERCENCRHGVSQGWGGRGIGIGRGRERGRRWWERSGTMVTLQVCSPGHQRDSSETPQREEKREERCSDTSQPTHSYTGYPITDTSEISFTCEEEVSEKVCMLRHHYEQSNNSTTSRHALQHTCSCRSRRTGIRRGSIPTQPL
jgi:hypothetical protein